MYNNGGAMVHRNFRHPSDSHAKHPATHAGLRILRILGQILRRMSLWSRAFEIGCVVSRQDDAYLGSTWCKKSEDTEEWR